MTTYIVTQGIQGPEGPQGATGPAGSGGGGGPIFARITPSYEPDFAAADTILTAAFGGFYDIEPFAESSVLDPAALRLVLPAEEQQGNTYAVAFPLSGVLSDYAYDEVIYGARLTSSMEMPDATAVTVSIADAGGLLPGKMGLFDDGLTYVADDGLVPGSALAIAGAAALLDEPIHEAATAASSYVVVTFNYDPAESNSEPLEWEGAIELLTVQGYPLPSPSSAPETFFATQVVTEDWVTEHIGAEVIAYDPGVSIELDGTPEGIRSVIVTETGYVSYIAVDTSGVMAAEVPQLSTFASDGLAGPAPLLVAAAALGFGPQPVGNAIFWLYTNAIVPIDIMPIEGGPLYTPANEADWPVVPTTIYEALDAIAARLTALEP